MVKIEIGTGIGLRSGRKGKVTDKRSENTDTRQTKENQRGISETTETQEVQSKSRHRIYNRTFENRFPYGSKLPVRRKGIQINALMAATCWNLKKTMEKLKEKFLVFILWVNVKRVQYRYDLQNKKH